MPALPTSTHSRVIDITRAGGYVAPVGWHVPETNDQRPGRGPGRWCCRRCGVVDAVVVSGERQMIAIPIVGAMVHEMTRPLVLVVTSP